MIKVKKRIFVILGFAIGLLFLCGSIMFQRSEHREPTQIVSSLKDSGQEDENNSSYREHSILKSQIARLEDKQHELSRKLHNLRNLVRAQEASISEDRKYDPRISESTELSQNTLEDHKTTNPISNHNTALQEETEDLEWRLKVETTVMATLEERDVANTLLDQIDCRQSVCQIDFVHPDAQGDESFIESVLPSEPFSGEFFSESTVNAEGLEMTIVYIARPARPNL